MSEQGEWGPWIEYTGGGCPVLIGQIVHAVYDAPGYDLREIAAAENSKVIAVGVDWVIKAAECRDAEIWEKWIARYRIRKPRGLTLLENIAQSVSEPTKEGAKA